MKFTQYLQEEYVASAEGQDAWDKKVNFPIYKNPTSSDYMEIRKADRGIGNIFLRTIIDLKNKNLYVWNALLGVHIQGFNALKKAGELKIEPDSAYNLFCGAADLKGNKLANEEALSFVEYITYYGLGNWKKFEDSTEDILKKTGWLKSYYRGKISVKTRVMGDPEILIL